MIDILLGIIGLVVGLPILACVCVISYEFFVDLKSTIFGK